eukprot:m.26466 g.26466  ORF g.26466 m.26466 type:complete len:485 (-) comp7801_c0_seq2:60-1514(-)
MANELQLANLGESEGTLVSTGKKKITQKNTLSNTLQRRISDTNEFGVDYKVLDDIIGIKGLYSHDSPQNETTQAAHDKFMDLVSNLVKQPNSKEDNGETPGAAVSVRPSTAHNLSPSNSRRKRSAKKTQLKNSLYNADIWPRLEKPYFKRSAEDVNLITEWAKKHLHAVQKRFSSSKLLHGVIETATFESYPTEGYILPWEFTNDINAVVLIGSVTITTESGRQFVVDAASAFGAMFHENKDSPEKLVNVTTKEKCDILYFSTNDCDRVRTSIVHEETRRKQHAMKAFPAVSKWPWSSLAPVLQVMEWKKFSKGEVISKQGTKASYLGFVVAGECMVHTKRKGENSTIRLGRLNVGQYFGEGCGLNVDLEGWNFKHSQTIQQYTVTASSNVTLLILTPKASQDLDPHFALEFVLLPNPNGFSSLSETDVEHSVLVEKLRLQWMQFKTTLLRDTKLDAHEFRHGNGKIVEPPLSFGQFAKTNGKL